MFNEILEGALNQAITRRLGMKNGSPAPAVAPELFPTWCTENDRPEWGYLKGESLRSRVLLVGAIAGQYSQVQIYIPTNRNSIAVLTRIVNVGATVVNVVRAGIGGGIAGWAGVAHASRDLREAGQGAGVLLESVQNAALPASSISLGRITTTVPNIDQPMILGPSGTALFFVGDAVNQAIQLNLFWYERTALPGELV